MLSIDVLKNKPVNNINSQDILDLTVSSISTTGQGSLSFIDVVQCPYELEMRPDLISKYYLNNQDNMGMLLKLNGISNPFSVEMGDIFFIPAIDSINSLAANNQNSKQGPDDRQSFRKKLSDRISKISGDRKNYLDARNISSAANSPLPPNVTQEGDQQFQVKNGKLIFGSNIGNSRTNISENKSKATIQSKLANKKIFGQ